jgi:hypothetical protein
VEVRQAARRALRDLQPRRPRQHCFTGANCSVKVVKVK